MGKRVGNPNDLLSKSVCGVAERIGSVESTVRNWLDYDAIALAVLAFGLVAVELLAFTI
jgi:hypothetical protein